MTGVSFRLALAALALHLLPAGAALAQPVDLPIPAARAEPLPAEVKIARAGNTRVYANRHGVTLYGMDMRTLIRFTADPARFCTGDCAAQWEPLLTPPGMAVNIRFPQGFGGPRQPLPAGFVNPQSAPDWTVIDGPAGPQWVYKGWHMVFTRKDDRPGSAAFDGADKFTWNTLKYVPPTPDIVAPPGVRAVLAGESHAFADPEGRVLYTGKCGKDCAGWTPFTAALAGRGLGPWTISTAGDRPQWLYRGKPVYVSREDDPLTAPAGTEVLRPAAGKDRP
ncbi:MAG: hypothetical protein KGL44_00600 [Sphingomonadales bacterium]|nr:hypothetical protein [Sphingomonadales bacterium]